ncbi:MAG: PTS sugar transporter subunit IIA [Candidatus Omnitrophota bacterium]
MFNIHDHINPRLITLNLQAKTKQEAIEMLVNKLFDERSDLAFGKDLVYKAILEREDAQTTGIGDKLAFPHARIDGWKDFVIVIGVNKEGIDFQSPDKMPAKFVCLMISSIDNPYTILQTMAAIARFFHNINGVETLLERATTPQLIFDEFSKYEVKTASLIHARDIMRPVKHFLKLNTSIEDVVRTMHLKHVDVLPVVDENNKICGQLSCLDIFEHGIPNFFKQLHTVSFVRHIDPFEKYFKIKRQLTVKDFLKSECATIPQEATLIEILFELTVKNKPRLFVTGKNSTLEGVIDRFSIVDKILFF